MRINKYCHPKLVSGSYSVGKKMLKSPLYGIPHKARQVQRDILWIGVFLFLSVSSLSAQIPRKISYQGVLTDNLGNPKLDGTYTITFSFYEAETGGDALWTESKTLSVTKGLFSTALGDQVVFGPNLKFDKPYWLGIKIANEPELSPRIALTSVGYSLTSGTTQGVENGVAITSLNGLKDNITLEGAGGTTINAAGNTITISSSGGGGTGIQGVQNTNNTIEITNPNGPTATVNVKVPLSISGSGAYYTLRGYNTGSGGGVWGETSNQNGSGVVGYATNGGWGVYGNSPNGAGIVGTSSSWLGVYGESNSYSGIEGRSKTGVGTAGISEDWAGVYGKSDKNSGVWGKSAFGYGVYGESTLGTAGVVGYSNSYNSLGALGYYNDDVFTGYGVYGQQGNSSLDYAGVFRGTLVVYNGLLLVTGDLSVSGSKNFKIDHPLDPKNKYLFHSCVESPERMNIYNGNIITDANGSATIELPEYFEALNVDYRYQLTVIGQFAQAIVENKIKNNRFTIKTDKPNVEVSWQVTGVRNDKYAKAHPFVVEQEKEEYAKGKYLMPELFGQPEEKGINYMKKLDFNKELNNANK